MATVYLARDLNLDTHVALKILNSEYAVQPNIRKRFIAEARSMFRMSHENIVRVYALVETEEVVAFAMEYIEGQTLRQCMLNEGRLPDDKIRAFLRQILGALRYVHSQQLVHRDIKPGNFMVDKQGNIKLMDFGIAKSLDARSADYTETGSGVQMGTPMYMSPEQITSSHAVTAQSDLYSLGVVLWELASGQRPYDSKSLSIPEIQVKVIKEPLPMLNSVWDYHIQKVTAKVPAGRYRSSQEWLLNLDRLEDTVPVEPPIAPTGGVTKGSATKGVYWIFGAACLFFLLVFFVSRNSNSSMEEDPIPFEVDVEVAVDTTAVQEAPMPFEADTTAVDSTAVASGMETFPSPSPNNRPSIEWVSIPAGTFTMGSPSYETDRESDEGPQHSVSLSGFKMSKYEVTFAQYDAFCGATGRQKPIDNGWGRGNRPVINVDWNDATAFAEWMGCRLPTEAEWEYACRAGTTSPFNTGSCLSSSQVNYDGNNPYSTCATGTYLEKTMPVGSYSPNAWGLYDMHGNAWEWCSDWYGDYSSRAQTNPRGPSSGLDRVLRGGSWFVSGRFCRSAFRYNFAPSTRGNTIGFRLVVPS